MKKISLITFLISGSLMSAFLMGCGGGARSALALTTGVRAMSSIVSGLGGTVGGTSAGHHLDPVYFDAYQVPTVYAAAISKMELLKSDTDTTPYVVFDTQDINSPKRIVMSGDVPVQFADNPSYPGAGTYTKMRVTLAYVEVTVSADTGDGNGLTTHSFRNYASTVGNVVHGDILVQVNNNWCWISPSGQISGGWPLPISNSRPGGASTGWVSGVAQAQVVQDHNWSMLAEQDTQRPANSDPYVAIVPLSSPVIVPANPSGLYTLSMSFEIDKTPEYQDATGVFMWTDLPSDINNPSSPGDGLFKPGVSWQNGGDKRDTIGALFDIQPPMITVAISQH